MGKLLDAEPLLKSLYKTGDEKTLSKDFNNDRNFLDFKNRIFSTN